MTNAAGGRHAHLVLYSTNAFDSQMASRRLLVLFFYAGHDAAGFRSSAWGPYESGEVARCWHTTNARTAPAAYRPSAPPRHGYRAWRGGPAASTRAMALSAHSCCPSSYVSASLKTDATVHSYPPDLLLARTCSRAYGRKYGWAGPSGGRADSFSCAGRAAGKVVVWACGGRGRARTA